MRRYLAPSPILFSSSLSSPSLPSLFFSSASLLPLLLFSVSSLPSQERRLTFGTISIGRCSILHKEKKNRKNRNEKRKTEIKFVNRNLVLFSSSHTSRHVITSHAAKGNLLVKTSSSKKKLTEMRFKNKIFSLKIPSNFSYQMKKFPYLSKA